MPTTRFLTTEAYSGAPTDPSVTAAELAFYERAETRAWWDADPMKGQKLGSKDYWEDRKNGFRLVPVNPTKPLSLSTGGPENGPVVQSQSSGELPDVLSSVSGDTIIPVGDLCLWSVVKAGSNSSATAMGLVGNNGGSLSLLVRNSDLVWVRVYPATSFLTRISQTLESDAYHLVQLNYDHAAGEISVWANGALLTGGAPANGIFGYSHDFRSARLSVFGTYDLTLGDLGVLTRNMPVAMCGVATTHAPDNAEWQAALEAMVAERFPSLGL